MEIDYRALNEKIVGDVYPLPNITEILDQLGGAKYFSVLDLASGFNQITMDVESRAKTAFTTPFAHLEFMRMTFSLKNAPATFQRLMDRVLSCLQGIELFVYMDDIVIYGKSLEDHANKLKALLGRLKQAGLTLHAEKCHFLEKQITYLGHIVSEEGVKPDPVKTEAVQNFPIPKRRKNIKQFKYHLNEQKPNITLSKRFATLFVRNPFFNILISQSRLLLQLMHLIMH